MLNKKIIAIGLLLVSSQSFAYSSYTQVYNDMPFPEYLRNVTAPEVKVQSMSLVAEGCNRYRR